MMASFVENNKLWAVTTIKDWLVQGLHISMVLDVTLTKLLEPLGLIVDRHRTAEVA